MREERSHETEDDEHPQRAEEVWHPAREVVLALAGEQCERNEDAECEDERLDDYPAVVEAGDDTDAVCFQTREAGQENEVCWVRLALPERQKHEADRSEERHPHHPLIRLDP